MSEAESLEMAAARSVTPFRARPSSVSPRRRQTSDVAVQGAAAATATSSRDDELLRNPAAIAGDPDCIFRDLVKQHRSKLYSFVLRKIGNATDAEDLTQQAFVDAAHNLASFRGDSALSTWLYGIAMNLVRNHLSRSPRRRYAFEDDSVIESMPSSMAGPERVAEARQLAEQLVRELDELPPEMRDVLMLVGVEEMSYEEAACLLSIPGGTVRSRVSRARSTLRERFAKQNVHSIV